MGIIGSKWKDESEDWDKPMIGSKWLDDDEPTKLIYQSANDGTSIEDNTYIKIKAIEAVIEINEAKIEKLRTQIHLLEMISPQKAALKCAELLGMRKVLDNFIELISEKNMIVETSKE